MEHKALGARVLEKAIQLLFSFETNIPARSVFELSRKLRFPPSTTHRFLKVMMSHRLIQQDHMTKLYRLGPGIVYLASVAKEGLSIRKIALPIMELLRDVTGENTALHELRDGKRVCIEKVESKEVLRDTILIGDQFPAHAGGHQQSIVGPPSERRIEEVPKFAEAFDASDASDNYRSKKVIVGTGAGQETRSRV
jgi:DNA-binding IclR family transcriptional regulator